MRGVIYNFAHVVVRVKARSWLCQRTLRWPGLASRIKHRSDRFAASTAIATMHRLAHGGRCVGILVIRRLFRFDFDRHANPHRPPPCIPQVASPREVAAMNTPHPTYPRLQALLGAALPGLQLSTAVAEALEDALAEANEQAAVGVLRPVARHRSQPRSRRPGVARAATQRGARPGPGRGNALPGGSVCVWGRVAGGAVGTRDG